VEHNPLANLSALDDGDAEEGLFDLIDSGNEALDELAQIVTRMGEATNVLGKKFNLRTREAKSITSSGIKADSKSAKRVSNSAANDLDVFVKRMSVEIPEFYKQDSIFTDSFSKVAMLTEQEFDKDKDDVKNTLANMKQYRNAIDSSTESLAEFRESISGLPKMTTTFNQARRRAVAIMDDLLNQLRISSSQAQDIEILLLRILNADVDEI
jgi:hypothetical protein